MSSTQTPETAPTFDQLIATGQSEIDRLLQAGAVDDANRKSYNLAADLAECWPGDDRPRSLEHLETGRALAERCVAWRHELGRGPRPFAIAHWVHGMHLLSIARRTGSNQEQLAAATAAFERSVTAAVAAAHEAGASTAVSADGDYLVILNTGFLALARELASPGAGKPLLEQALEAFRLQVERHPDRAEEARFGRENLEVVIRRFLER